MQGVRRGLLALLCSIVVLGSAAPAASASGGPCGDGFFHSTPKVALHVTPFVTKACVINAPQVPCSQLNLEGPADGSDQLVYVMGFTGYGYDGIFDVRFGIHYENLDYFAWSSCAEQVFPSSEWPSDSSHVTVTWQDCQTDDFGEGKQVIAGYFHVSATQDARLDVIPPITPSGWAVVTECGPAELPVDPSQLGWALLTEPAVPVVPKTWGRLKQLWDGSR